MIQAAFQTLETEGVSTGSGDRLVEQPGKKKKKKKPRQKRYT